MRIEKTPRSGAPVAVRTDPVPDETARRATPAAGLRAASRQPTPLFASRHSPPPARPAERSAPPSPPAVGEAFPKAPLPRPMGPDRRRAAQLRRVAVDETAGRFKGIPPGRGSRGSDRRSIGRIPIGPRRAAREQRGHRRHAARRLAEDGASRERRHRAWGLEILTAVSQELRSWTGLGRGRLTRQGAVVEGEVAQLHGLHRGDVRYLPRPLYVPRLARVRDHRRR